MRDSRFV